DLGYTTLKARRDPSPQDAAVALLLLLTVPAQLGAGEDAVAIAVVIAERLVVAAPLVAGDHSVAVAVHSAEAHLAVSASAARPAVIQAIGLRQHPVAIAVETIE